MAENILWLVNERFPNERIIVWIATPHAIHEPADATDSAGAPAYDGMVTTGKHLRDAVGDQLYTLAFTASGGSIQNVYDSVASAVPAPGPGSVEYILQQTPGDVIFQDLRHLPAGHPLGAKIPAILGGYTTTWAHWSRQIDGVNLIKRMTPVTRAAAP
jgi:erythromycin esterase-like protein